MANRYWIGDSGNWTDTAHWSDTSGGTGGFSVPTSSDDVFFDANSFTTSGQKVTVNSGISCRDMSWVGVTNSPLFRFETSSGLTIYGNLTLSTGMSFESIGVSPSVSWTFAATSTGKTVTMAGRSFPANWIGTISFNGVGGGWTLQDALNAGKVNLHIGIANGTLNTNGFTVTTREFDIQFGTKTLNMGSSTFEVNSWNNSNPTNLTLNAGTSTIVAGLGNWSFNGGGSTYYNLNITDNFGQSSDANAFSITGSNTFQNLTISVPTTNTRIVKFTAGTTQTILGNLVISGTAAKVTKLFSVTAGSKWNLYKSSSGDFVGDYLDVKDSSVSGADQFIMGTGFVDSGNNSGWGIDIPDITKSAQYTVAAIGNITKSADYDVEFQSNLGSTVVSTYYIDGHTQISDFDGAWTNDANAFDNDATPSTFAEATLSGSTSTNSLFAEGSTAPASGSGTITQVRARIYAQARAAGNYVYAYIDNGNFAGGSGTPYVFGNTPGWGSWETLSAITGGWTWQKVRDLQAWIYLQGSGTTNTGKIYKVEIEVSYSLTGVPAEYEVGTNLDITKSAAYAVREYISNVKDLFDDNSLNTALWTNWGGSQVAETNSQLQITTTGSPAYYGINTAGLYNLTGSYSKVRLAEAPPTNIGSLEVDMSISKDSSNRYQIIWYMNAGTPTIVARKVVAGISTDLGSIAFNFATMSHWQIKEAGGTVSIQYSGDGITWTTLGTNATSAFDIKNMYVDLEAGTWQASGNTAVIKLDDYNYTFSTNDILKTADYDVAVGRDITKTAAYVVIIPQVNVFVTPWLKPYSGTNDTSFGTFAFQNPVNIEQNNAGYAHFFHSQAGPTLRNKNWYIVKDGVVGGTNMGNAVTDVFPFSLTTYTVGGQTEKWGNVLEVADVNDPTFGIAYGVGVYNPSLTSQSNYLRGADYRPNIPTLNTFILGIESRVTWTLTNVGGGTDRAEFYDLEMRVHYGINILWESNNTSQAFIKFDQEVYPETDTTKAYQYAVFNQGEFLGEWKDVVSEPKVTNAINSIPAPMQIELGRTISKVPKIVDTIWTEDSQDILDNYGQEIYGQFEDTQSLGAGSDLEVDFDVDVKEYYGGYEPLVNENLEPILTPDLQFIAIPVGYPKGRKIFTGFISNFGIQYAGAQSKVLVRLLHHAEELNNEIYKTSDVVQITNYYTGDNNGYAQFGGANRFAEDTISVAQTFQTGSAFLLGSFTGKFSGWTGNVITGTIRTGATPGAGTIVGSGSATILGNLADPVQKLVFSLATPVQLAGSTSYNIVFTASLEKTHGSGSHSAYMYFGSALANAQGYYSDETGTVFTALTPSGQDFSIELLSYGGDTTVIRNSVDPTDNFKAILDYNKSTGGVIGYVSDNVETTNSVVTAKFNTNTIKEALDYNNKLSPADWFYYIDSGNIEVDYRSKSSNLSHTFRLGVDIIDVEVNKTIEQLANIVYFTGGALNPFIKDTFTGNYGLSVLNKPGELGSSWTRIAGDRDFLISDTNTAYPSGGTVETFLTTSGKSLSDDYTVEADWVIKSNITTNLGIMGRMNGTTTDGYMLRLAYNGTSFYFDLHVRVGGVWQATLQTVTVSPSVGQTYRVKLEMIGNSIKGYIDGKVYLDQNNNAISSGKYSGLYLATSTAYNTGYHLDNFQASSDVNSKTNILRKYTDTTSVNTYRKALRKISDNRVTDYTTADILGTAEINQYKDPLFAGKVRILRDKHQGIVKPGQLVNMTGFGNFIDDIMFQTMKVVTTPTVFEVELGILLPKVSKRVEDIKRNLNLLEQNNNPTAPQ